MNHFLYSLAQFVCSHAISTFAQSEVYGLNNIPRNSGFILAANHLSYIDPPAFGCYLKQKPYYFARESLFKPGLPRWLLMQLKAIPARSTPGFSTSALKHSLKVLQSSEGLIFFPEGTRSATGCLQKAKAGIGLIACKTQLPVIPSRIFGSDRFLGKAQVSFDLTRAIDITFGKPLYPEDYDVKSENASNRYHKASTIIMQAISDLKPFRPPSV